MATILFANGLIAGTQMGVNLTLNDPTLILLVALILLFSAYVLFRILSHPGFKVRMSNIAKKGGVPFIISIILEGMKTVIIRVFNRLISTPRIFIDKYYFASNAEIVLYDIDGYKYSSLLNYQPRVSLESYDPDHTSVKVSLIGTVRNEGSNITAWAKSVFEQTRLPDEIIITDAGSTDETPDLLRKIAGKSPVPFTIIIEPGANIARGRNLAIAKARFDHIATTDFGCRLHPDWLEKILAPFEADSSIEVSAGMYQAIDRKGKKIDRRAWWTNDAQINLRWFLPSGRSSAFTKQIWETVGGYPEWLTLTGEDTFFALELKKYAKKWAFVPQAMMDWYAPDTTLAYWQKMYHWSVGEGESGLYASSYWKLTVQILVVVTLFFFMLFTLVSIWIFPGISSLQILFYLLLPAWSILFIAFCINQKIAFNHLFIEFGGLIAKILGFLDGAHNRGQVDLKRHELVKGTFFILSGVPIDDTGGGARCTQISLELLKQRYAVVFINKYPKYESRDLKLSILDNNLFIYQLSELDWNKFSRDNEWLLKKQIIGVLVEMPIEDFLPIIDEVRKHGGVVIYDLLDDWNTQLGGNWYSEQVEAEIIKMSRVLVATAPILADRLSQMSSIKVELLPNAVNSTLFNPDRHFERPPDLPVSEWVAIYTGALWGEWFDWELLAEVANKYPEASVVVIGDYRGQFPMKLPNLHFLGLKPQGEIPSYLAFSDVALIPWKANKITQATSPLKVYEYLAMRKPVIAPDIHPLRGIPGVYLAQDRNDYVELVGKARTALLPIEQINQFIRANNWQARVDRLLDLLISTR